MSDLPPNQRPDREDDVIVTTGVHVGKERQHRALTEHSANRRLLSSRDTAGKIRAHIQSSEAVSDHEDV